MALLDLMRRSEVRSVSATPSYWCRLIAVGRPDDLSSLQLRQITLARSPVGGESGQPGEVRHGNVGLSASVLRTNWRARGKILRRTPLGRLGVPEDIIGPVKFLLSDGSKFVTGQLLIVDGGILA